MEGFDAEWWLGNLGFEIPLEVQEQHELGQAAQFRFVSKERGAQRLERSATIDC